MENSNTEQSLIAFYSKLRWLELVLLILNICFSCRLGIERLTQIKVMHISFDWMAMFFSIIILNSCIHGRKTNSSGSFMKLTVIIYLLLFLDVGCWVVDDMPQYRILNYLCNIGCNSGLLLSAMIYIEFVYDSMDISEQRSSVLYRSVVGMTALSIAAELLNYRFGYFYHVDASGAYQRVFLGSMLSFLPCIYVLSCSCVVVFRQKISFRMKLSYWIYVIVPFGISIWYTVTGLPPTIYLAPFIALVIVYEHIYIHQGEELERIKLENAQREAQIAWQRNQITLSQIRPHFIFNCLGSIEQLCKSDAAKARMATHRFAKYLRVNMDAIGGKTLIPFSKELEHIHNYVWLEQMRFGEELVYEESIETEAFYIPPLCVQPLVENAIKHGMMGMEKGILTVTLTVIETPSRIIIRIRDNGNGFCEGEPKPDGRSHLGVLTVRESLAHAVNGRLELQSETGKGVTAEITIERAIEDEDFSS